MSQNILFITPPFTQLNTPYPATMYLKGFLNTQGIASHQMDLGIEVILAIFSKEGLTNLFQEIDSKPQNLSVNAKRIITLKREYIDTIEPTISFLQNRNPTLAHSICNRNFLPEAARFTDEANDLDWAFGTMGLHDQARHLATLYLEDLSDLIIETIDPHFGFSRYAESLGRCATSFEPIENRLKAENQWIDEILIDLLSKKIVETKPTVVGLTVPFPGNLYGALKCGQHLKAQHPEIKVILGGGYPNTELRSFSEEKLFEYVDYVTLDDGELPIIQLLRLFEGEISESELKRTFLLRNCKVEFIDNPLLKDFSQKEVGTPDYSDLPLSQYLSVIELVNPMHRLWSDGRWNKLTLAHGCYWGRCTFCDTTLDYIKRFEPSAAVTLCDRMESIIAQTGQNGFHFVDEAAPPALLRELSLEILRRGLRVVWWTNVRFEKSYTFDLCRLMKSAGCIAVSGGLEVASDRLLALINKGVSVAQVANVANHFTQNGIMVHAYLMYGFPTETERETIDALEMVRQLFSEGVLQSGFWHLFTLTAHSPIGQDPAEFGILHTANSGKFANNDVSHQDPTGADHIKHGDGLRKALYNYMHEAGFDLPLSSWFDFKTPPTTIPRGFIHKALEQKETQELPLTRQVVWLGGKAETKTISKIRKGKQRNVVQFTFHLKTFDLAFETSVEIGNWLADFLSEITQFNRTKTTVEQMKQSFEAQSLGDFNQFWQSKTMTELRDSELLIL
ncbi:MAG: B12-binding domain-containing radical SAM protein [Bacteroidales bacterium]